MMFFVENVGDHGFDARCNQDDREQVLEICKEACEFNKVKLLEPDIGGDLEGFRIAIRFDKSQEEEITEAIEKYIAMRNK